MSAVEDQHQVPADVQNPGTGIRTGTCAAEPHMKAISEDHLGCLAVIGMFLYFLTSLPTFINILITKIIEKYQKQLAAVTQVYIA